MIATIINTITVIIGSFIGLLFHKKITDAFKSTVFSAIGLIAAILGIKMALEGTRILYMAFSLILGGLLGEWWDIEGGILRFGEFLKRHFAKNESGKSFAYGFLDASIIFCVGAMSLVGAFKAGAEGDYSLILTKAIMDGFMAIMLTSAMGIGVMFSAITILVYQGSLTIAASWLQPLVNKLVISELTGVGGILVIMIGINILGLRKIKTANFLPSLILVVIFVALDKFF